ncbi:hypothetical protein FHU30_004058 [Actinomadura rupiterrae]|nr:hypothetical protein [Actinomadura rupiterrae]
MDGLVADALKLPGHLPDQELGDAAAGAGGLLADSASTADLPTAGTVATFAPVARRRVSGRGRLVRVGEQVVAAPALSGAGECWTAR